MKQMFPLLTQDGKIRGRVFGYQQTGDSYLDHYELEKMALVPWLRLT